MKSCWGVTALPDTFIAQLPRNKTWSYATEHPSTKTDVQLVVTMEAFKARYHALQKYRGVVIVIDVAERLRNWNIPVIACDRASVRHALASTNTVLYVPRDPIKKLLKNSTGSFVSNFMTMVYQVKDPERQTNIRDTVFTSLCENQVDDLCSRISRAAGDLARLLASDDTRRLASAIHSVKTGTPLKQAARENTVAAFDIQYTLKYVERLQND